MNTVVRTAAFDKWLAKLKDLRGKFGDCASVGSGVSEMRIHFGPGYRVYFCRTDDVVFVLLCGDTKRRQRRDIIEAQAIARRLMEN